MFIDLGESTSCLDGRVISGIESIEKRDEEEGEGVGEEKEKEENENERIVGDTGGRKLERDGGTRKKSSRKAVKVA